jgi:hypothetical protein
MTTNPTGTPRYLRTPDAAKVVGLSIRTLEKHRINATRRDLRFPFGRGASLYMMAKSSS